MRLTLPILLIIFVSCSPCKRVAKHPECFSPDTIIEQKFIIKTQKEYITQDSIVYDTVPCDPIKPEVEIKTIWKTHYITKSDTIFTNNEVIKTNPINTQLKSDNEKLKDKNTSLKIWNHRLIIILLILIVIPLAVKLVSRFFPRP